MADPERLALNTPKRREKAELLRTYTEVIDPGVHLMYRRGKAGGQWYGRRYSNDGAKRYTVEHLAIADDTLAADGVTVLSYAQALAALTRKAEAAPPPKKATLTVQVACEDYVTYLRAHRKTAKDTEARLKKHAYPVLGLKLVTALTKTELEAWHIGMVRHDDDDADVERASKDSANRVLSMLKAALNRAFADEANAIPADAAWRKVKPFRGVRRARQVHLDKAQCKRLLLATTGAFRRLVTAALLTGARPPHELVTPKVKAFNAELAILSVDGKTGPRDVVLNSEAVAFFEEIIKDRDPEELLLPRDDGAPWGKNHHIRPMEEAVKRAKLPDATTLYALRHTHISQALLNNMNIKLLADNCGTSIAMIEDHYGKFLAGSRRKLIEKSGFRLDLKLSKEKSRA
jgi:site-specific recombinase XerD